MPHPIRTIAVTGANSRTGRQLLPRLAGPGVRVVALVRTAQDLPADEVVEDWTNAPRAVEVLREASAVVHLSGVFAASDWDSYRDGTVATTRRVVEAMNPAARLVCLSYVEADPAGDNWYIKSKGQAEELVSTVADSVIFRIDALAGGRDDPAPFELMYRQAAPGVPVRVIGDGTQRFRPVYSADAVEALVKAAGGDGRPGTYDLVGPGEFLAADLPGLINGRPVPVEYVSAGQATAVSKVPHTLADLLANHAVPPGSEAVAHAFGLSLTCLETTWPIGTSGDAPAR
ncbi:NAD-dependent epimerase/dehydratase family protein [Streptomyces sp. NPDC059788]|uniref:NAD-dependent epimerase/dehydratase family protein n=1 Tax=Streptomyces sp. NPDC059788 TaxID=3346948 RepID=UPI003651D28F